MFKVYGSDYPSVKCYNSVLGIYFSANALCLQLVQITGMQNR